MSNEECANDQFCEFTTAKVIFARVYAMLLFPSSFSSVTLLTMLRSLPVNSIFRNKECKL